MIECTTRSREAHESREALIEAFIESRGLPPGDRLAVEEIIEADRLWCRLIAIERDARALASAGS